MSLLKKLFKSTEKSDASKAVAALRARLPRVQLGPLHRINFRFLGASPDSNQEKVANISIGGMAIIHGGSPIWKADAKHSGLLQIDRDEFEIALQVRHLGQIYAGCQFTGVENLQLKRAIESYLRVEILALKLRPVNPSVMKPDRRGQALWFTDGRQNELYVVYDDSGMIAFHLSFLGNYVEGASGQKVRAGSVRDQQQDVPGHKASSMLDLNREPVGDILNMSQIFVRNIEGLPNNLQSEICANIGG